MTEQHVPANGTQAAHDDGQPRTSQVWAVVQTGFITQSADIVSFVDDTGAKCPQLIRVVGDERQANTVKNRLSTLSSKVKAFGKINGVKTTPIYGLMQLTVDGAKKGRTMTAEQKKAAGERLAAARKRSKK